MSDEELAERIRSVASGHGITSMTAGANALELCRKLEGAGDVEPAGRRWRRRIPPGSGRKAGQAGEAASPRWEAQGLFPQRYDFITGLLENNGRKDRIYKLAMIFRNFVP
jgi:hypothetical protein